MINTEKQKVAKARKLLLAVGTVGKANFRIFEKDIAAKIGINTAQLKNQEDTCMNNSEFNKFIVYLMKARVHLMDGQVPQIIQLYNFYSTLLECLISSDKDVISNVQFYSKDLLSKNYEVIPKVIVELSLYEKSKEKGTYKHLVEHMMPYLLKKTGTFKFPFFGFLLTLEEVQILWIEEFDADSQSYKLESYSFEWFWAALRHVFGHLEDEKPIKDLDYVVYKRICQFYTFMNFFSQIASMN